MGGRIVLHGIGDREFSEKLSYEKIRSIRVQVIYLENAKLTEESAASIAKLNLLQGLHFRHVELTDAQFTRIVDSCPDIQHMTLVGAPLSSAIVPSIAKLNKLEALVLTMSHADDRAIAALTGCEELKWLEIASTAITNSCCDDLVALKNLTYLNVSKTALTDDAIDRLRNAMPMCEIVATD